MPSTRKHRGDRRRHQPRPTPQHPAPTTRYRPTRQAPYSLRAPDVLQNLFLTAAFLILTAAAPAAAQESGHPPAKHTDAESAETACAAEGPTETPFTQERFEELQEKDALILVDIFADWCPVCKPQQKVLADFREEHPGVALHTLKVNFDEQKEWVKHFRARRQSTLILFRGEERVWFGVAENRREVICRRILEAAEVAGTR